MKKILVLCGLTATGKTKLALSLARKLDGELISADSRQVYQYLDIGTGKDIPKNYKFQLSKLKFKNIKIGYYTDKNTKIWGYDLVKPNQKFSVYHYAHIAQMIISDIMSRGKLPIIVGGTGLYIDVIFYPPATIGIPVNKKLRSKLEKLSQNQLFTLLLKLDSIKLNSLNSSDRKNPRRLIRAIEVAKFHKKHHISNQIKNKLLDHNMAFDPLWIGLTVRDKDDLFTRIDKRVEYRVKNNFDSEYAYLKSKRYLKKVVKDTIGYTEWDSYKKGKVSQSEAIFSWKLHEHAYARKQLVWFSKNQQIKWFLADDQDFLKNVTAYILQWYTKNIYASEN